MNEGTNERTTKHMFSGLKIHKSCKSVDCSFKKARMGKPVFQPALGKQFPRMVKPAGTITWREDLSI